MKYSEMFPTKFLSAADLNGQARFADRFVEALARANVPRRGAIPFHRLRHTFASELLARGTPLFRVSRWLGHSAIKLTADTYGHLVPDEGDHAEIDQLDHSPSRSVPILSHAARSRID